MHPYLCFTFRRLSFRFVFTIQLNRLLIFMFFNIMVAFSVMSYFCCSLIVFFTFLPLPLFFFYKNLFCPKDFRPFVIGQVTLFRVVSTEIYFNGHLSIAKNAKHLKRNLIRISQEIIFLSPFLSFPFCSGLIGLGLYQTGLSASYCVLRRANKCVCACLCFEDEGAY